MAQKHTATASMVLLASSCWSARSEYRSTWKDVEAPIVGWIQERAIPLTTVHPSALDDDLLPVGELVRGASLVALGEATHGTEEFFLLKHRLVEHLVEHEGFRVFAIEDDFALVEDLDRFVQGEDLSLNEAMGELHPVWNCEAPRGLLRWMRDYNARASPERRVHVFGFDAYAAAVSAERIVAHLREVDPDLVPVAEAKLERARDVYAHRWELSYADAAVADVEALIVELQGREARHVERAGRQRWQVALHHAEHVQQVVDVVNVRRRDWHMARNLLGCASASPDRG